MDPLGIPRRVLFPFPYQQTRIPIRVTPALPIAALPRCAVDPNLSAAIVLASSTSTPIKTTTRLEQHVGVVVAAAAAALGAAMGEEFKSGVVSASTKTIGGETVAELLKLYFLTAANFDFERVARERGVEVLLANDISPGIAESLVDETLKILAAVTRNS